ncbi:MAG TPA: chloramphenicol acetyltransferase [Mobilitalea sp.]|nr:chloramphenicol acetyltransferase [Mobilitalea sp.]
MKIIDINTWNRAEHYQFFKGMDYPQYNICMNIDITHFLDCVKKKKLPFYYAMIYASSTVLNEFEEFRYRIHNDQVVLHDRVHPSFTDMSKDTDLFKIVTINLDGTMEEFIDVAKKKSEEQKEYFPMADMAGRDDLIYITCIPWISFTHLSHTINLKQEDACERISWGKYFVQEEKTLLPFSVQVNHAFVDGYYVGRYVERLQEYLDNFQ